MKFVINFDQPVEYGSRSEGTGFLAKVTLKDVAREAGVGTATVERVINGRSGVGSKTAEKVYLAVRRLNYRPSVSEGHRGLIRIEVILVRPETSFYSRMNHAFERIAASLNRSIVVHRTFARENDVRDFSHRIENESIRRSALIVVAPDHPEVIHSMKTVAASGMPVIQIMTRPSHDLPYVGIDNYAAGRTAAHYMSRMLAARQGTFVALCHSGAYENHKQRINGFSSYIAEKPNQGHHFSQVMLDFDNDRITASLMRDLLRTSHDLIGIYTAGGDNKAVATALKAHRERDIFWVGHELSRQTEDYLRQGVMSIVLDQAPEIQARRSLDTALKMLGLIDVDVSTEPVRFLTVTSENV